jgi:Tol biopolymer transport system component
MAAEGGELRRVLADCQCRDPIYSHDGDRLYYVDYVDSQHGLWEVPVSGEGAPRRLYEAPLRFLSLAPDGRTLAASRHQLESDLWSIEVDPRTGAPIGEAVPFTLEDVDRIQFPVSSPDGARIAFIVTRAGNVRELWMARMEGGGAELLVAGGVGGWSAWSDDSRQVFFVNANELQRLDTTTRRVETVFRTDLEWQTPAVAPRGDRVAFTLTDANGISNVWTLDASGKPRQVTHETNDTAYPTWSPDGRWLAVEMGVPGLGDHLGYVSADGGTPVDLTEHREQCYHGGWSPDGDKIAYARRPIEGPEEHWDVWWISRSSRERRRLTERPPYPGREFVRYPSWSAGGERIFFELAQSRADLWVFQLPAAASTAVR